MGKMEWKEGINVLLNFVDTEVVGPTKVFNWVWITDWIVMGLMYEDLGLFSSRLTLS